MPMFRTKPVTIEARQLPDNVALTPLLSEFADLRQGIIPEGLQGVYSRIFQLSVWCGGKIGRDSLGLCIEIDTLEGTMLARPGDWIIKGVQGEFSISPQKAFLADYEEVSA